MSYKRRNFTDHCNGWKHSSLAKKMEGFRLLREAIENGKSRLVEPKCCHSQVIDPPSEKDKSLSRLFTSIDSIYRDDLTESLRALKMTEMAKKKRQLERKIEIVKRLLTERSLRKNDKSLTKLRKKITKGSVLKYVDKKFGAVKVEGSYDSNKYKFPEMKIPASSGDTNLQKNMSNVQSTASFDENIYKTMKHSYGLIDGNYLEESVKCHRYSETMSEKIEKGKLQFDKGWSVKPAEIKFKYESDKSMAVYKKTIIITNTRRFSACCGFFEVKCNTLVHPNTFSGSRDIERVYPGMSMRFDLQFCSHGEIFSDLLAKLYFLTRRESLEGFIEIPVLCQPTVCDHLEPSLLSTNIHFRKANYWAEPSTKTLLLTNPLDTPCEVYLNADTDQLIGAFNEDLRRFDREKKTYVLDKTYGKKIKRELSKIIANYIIQYILNNIFEPIQTSPRFFAVIPKHSKLPLTVKFIPQLVYKKDFVVKKINANYSKKNKIFLRNEITIHAKTEDLPIVLQPHLLDFKIGLVGVSLQQTAFTLTNTGRIPILMKATTVRSMKDYIKIRPNSFVVLSGQSTAVGVCLKLGTGFRETANEFINEEMRLLEFPIYIETTGALENKIMPLILPAMAVLTNCFALTVSEKFIDFGTVYLSTCSSRRLEIVNQSPLIQFYGFLNVPNNIIIEPGCGFGYIFPGEARYVDLIFCSPGYEEIACNGKQKCINNVISLYTALSASHFKNIKAKISKYATENKEMQNTSELKDRDSNLEEVEEENGEIITTDSKLNKITEHSQQISSLLSKNIIDLINNDNKVNPLDVSYESMKRQIGSFIYDENTENKNEIKPPIPTKATDSFALKDSEVESTQIESDYAEDEIQPKEAIYSIPIEWIARVMRQIMEFSSQKVLLQPTPYGSSTYASVYLRERLQDACICGRKPKRMKFTGHYYLTTNDKSVNVQPIAGKIHENMCEKVFIEFRPRLEKDTIEKAAQELQMEAENKLFTESDVPKKVTKKSKPKSSKKAQKKTAGSSAKQRGRKVEKIDETLIQEARELLLKSSIEPIRKTVIIQCRLQILLQNGQKDDGKSDQYIQEEIECHVVCTVVKPDFILKCARELDFGLVAEGMRKTISVEVKSISEDPFYLRLSHLSPIGSFSHSLRTLPIQCRNYRKIKRGIKEIHRCSILIDPEEIREIRLTFSANSENMKNFERLDVEGGKTKVFLLLKAQIVARGVQFNPTIDLYTLQCGFGGHQQVDILVSSTSKALQHLSIKREYLKAIPLSIMPEFSTTKPEKNKSSKSQQRTVSKKSDKKMSGKHTPQNLYEEQKRFLDEYESEQKYSFEDLFSLTFEAPDTVKTKKGKTNSKEKSKRKEESENQTTLSPNEKREIYLPPMSKCRLTSIFSLKEADQLRNTVKMINEKFSSDIYEIDAKSILSMQDHTLNSRNSKNDDQDSIAFYRSMFFVAKYNIILGVDTVLLDLYFIGNVKGKN